MFCCKNICYLLKTPSLWSCLCMTLFLIIKQTKTYAVGTHQQYLTKALQMSTHNIPVCFCWEIRKLLMWILLLYRAMIYYCMFGYPIIHRGSYTNGHFIRNLWNESSASHHKFHMKWPRDFVMPPTSKKLGGILLLGCSSVRRSVLP